MEPPMGRSTAALQTPLRIRCWGGHWQPWKMIPFLQLQFLPHLFQGIARGISRTGRRLQGGGCIWTMGPRPFSPEKISSWRAQRRNYSPAFSRFLRMLRVPPPAKPLCASARARAFPPLCGRRRWGFSRTDRRCRPQQVPRSISSSPGL